MNEYKPKINVRKTVIVMVVAVIVMAVAGWLLSRENFYEMLAAVKSADPLLIAAAIAIYFISVAVWAARWQTAMSFIGCRMGFGIRCLVICATIFLNNITPMARAGGDPFGRAYMMRKFGNISYSAALASIIGERALTPLVIVSFLMAGLIFRFGEGSIQLTLILEVVWAVAGLITDGEEVAALAAKYRSQPIDVLINNAAHLGPRVEQEFGRLEWDLFEESFETNAVGRMRVTQAFVDNVAASRGKRIVTLSSAAGSITALTAAPVQFHQYRASKAALNMLMHGVALDLAGRGIVVGLVNPGLVDTRGVMNLKPGDPVPDEFAPVMPLVRSGVIKLITPAESVSAMIRLIDGLTPEQSGKFLNYEGQPLPW